MFVKNNYEEDDAIWTGRTGRWSDLLKWCTVVEPSLSEIAVTENELESEKITGNWRRSVSDHSRLAWAITGPQKSQGMSLDAAEVISADHVPGMGRYAIRVQ